MAQVLQSLDQSIIEIFGTQITDQFPILPVFSEETGVTLIPSDKDAFNLNPPANSPKTMFNVKRFNFESLVARPGQTKQIVAIYRTRIGYALASRCKDNKATLSYVFSNIINNALIALTNELGDLRYFTIEINRQHSPEEILIDRPESMTYEMRFSVYAPVQYKPNPDEWKRDE